MRRHKMKYGTSRRHFRQSAGVHPMNSLSSSGSVYVMRGGIRL